MQQQVEQRLKRIHDRQEAARKLAQNVEILLQQRSISGASRGSSCHNTHHMTSSELFATARHVARDFRTLTSQMTKDFALDDKNNNVAQKNSTCIKTRQAKHSLAESSVNDNNRSVAFTVGFDDDKGPLSPVPKTFKVPNKTQKTRLTAEELEEKQRKAEERRTVSNARQAFFLSVFQAQSIFGCVFFTWSGYFLFQFGNDNFFPKDHIL